LREDALERGCARTTSATAGASRAQRRSTRRHTIDGYKDDRWTGRSRRRRRAGVVVTAPKTGPARLRIGRYTPTSSARVRVDARTSPAICSSRATSSTSAIDEARCATAPRTVTLEQTPLAEGAMVAIDNATGQIKAMVGGWSFSRSKFNRAVQAYRQLGIDVQTDRLHRGDRSRLHADLDPGRRAGQLSGRQRPDVQPAQLRSQVRGPVTLRWALEESRNIPAIKMMDTLGPKNVLEYAKRFGFEEDFPPYLPIALGAGDATLLEVTSAYTAFPNQGVRMKPISILSVKDRDGNLLEENRSEPTDVIRADTAFVMTNLLRGVLTHGTGRRAINMASQWPLAGKTGTVDDNTDAWFVGFDPDITVGVWIGFDDKRKSLGTAEQGSFVALPIWMEFMQAYIDGRETRTRRRRSKRRGTSCFSRSTSRTVRCRRPTAPA
jgi:penicillin-binding protein 1A